ncbi:RDD family protein [Hymenobacter jejuensis]|uniref:RDD family protein n=1 Tax=Hymenobacter jejuensis TaxID=2502781 RepID=A0A5B8A1D8_9BACT|nr:RDD family protein [Hymenobacter jejuensis]QDA61140.1 RDD family protein [Hymenobacter jejuensis]
MEVTSTDSQETAEQLELAGKGRRFANYLLDLVFIYAFAFQIGIILSVAGMEAALNQLDNPLLGRLFGVLVLIVYYLFFETVFGRTIGKMITGTRVVTYEGTQPDFRTVFKRTMWRCVPYEAFSFLKSEQGKHDLRSETIVIRVRK